MVDGNAGADATLVRYGANSCKYFDSQPRFDCPMTAMSQGVQNPSPAGIFAVIVTFQPDAVLLVRLLDALALQVQGGVIVNNGNDLPLPSEFFLHRNFTAIHLKSNFGVATALNVGFQWAENVRAEFVITFDQDSEPAVDMVSQLLVAFNTLVLNKQRVGAVGPQHIDRRSGRKAVFLSPITWSRHRVVPLSGQTIEVDHLITSGCLMRIQTWKEVGHFLDDLFIDYVDIEWSLRLRHHGWKLFGVGDAQLLHSIGDDIKRFWGREFALHSALRHYFVFRNGVYLQTLPYISFRWKLSDAIQLTKKLVLFTLASRPRSAHLSAMLTGIKDGWRGRLGGPRLAAEEAKLAQNSEESKSN